MSKQRISCQFCYRLYTPPDFYRSPSQTCTSCWLEINSRLADNCGFCGAFIRGFVKLCECGKNFHGDSNCWSQHYNQCVLENKQKEVD